MLKIRRPLGRLIFNMGIAIPGKTVFLIETAPRCRIGERIKQDAQKSLLMRGRTHIVRWGPWQQNADLVQLRYIDMFAGIAQGQPK